MKLLEMKNIVKSFYGVVVVNQVNLSVGTGEIHALLGENGAGKTTLMNVLGGALDKDSGELFFDEKEYPTMNPKLASSIGIGFVHQELNLINDLLVYENIFFGSEIVKGIRLNKKEMVRQTKSLLEKLHIDISPYALVDGLDASEKQLIEIAKVLHQNAKLIIMDEPTTSLNIEEVNRLFSIMKNLKKQGTSIIYISHKMPEIFEVCDTYTVLRNGLLVDSGYIKNVDTESITKKMVGNEYVEKTYYQERAIGNPIMTIENLSGEGFEDVNLTINRGEVFVLTGLHGSGTSSIVETLFGLRSWTSGSVIVNGESLKTGSILNAMKNKISLVPRNRKENALLTDLSIQDNMSISKFILSKGNVIRRKTESKIYEKYKEILSIKAEDKHDSILSLSGGNQQKVIIARWLATNSDILIFDNPTQGVDVGAKSQVYKLIMELAAEGITIIVNTLEIPELQKIADRCAVFYHGKLMIELGREEITEEKIMLYATNSIGNRGTLL